MTGQFRAEMATHTPARATAPSPGSHTRQTSRAGSSSSRCGQKPWAIAGRRTVKRKARPRTEGYCCFRSDTAAQCKKSRSNFPMARPLCHGSRDGQRGPRCVCLGWGVSMCARQPRVGLVSGQRRPERPAECWMASRSVSVQFSVHSRDTWQRSGWSGSVVQRIKEITRHGISTAKMHTQFFLNTQKVKAT